MTPHEGSDSRITQIDSTLVRAVHWDPTARGQDMGRVIGWTGGVLVVVVGLCSLTVAPWLSPWWGLCLVLVVPVALIVSLIRARRRGIRLIDAQRLDGHALQSGQDDLLGRTPYPAFGDGVDGPTPISLVDPDAVERDPGRLDR